MRSFISTNRELRKPKFDRFPQFLVFSTKLYIFHSFFNFLPLGWLPGALGPFSKERSHFSASDGTPKTSVRWNLTRFRTVQSSKFQVFWANPKKHGLDFWETPGGGKEIWICVFLFHFLQWFDQDINFLSSARWSKCTRVEQQDKRPAPIWA